MPRDSARGPQLPTFVHDHPASPEAFARSEAIPPVLQGERSLPQQGRSAGIGYWRLWRDLRPVQRAGLLGLPFESTTQTQPLEHALGPDQQVIRPRTYREYPTEEQARSSMGLSSWPLDKRGVFYFDL